MIIGGKDPNILFKSKEKQTMRFINIPFSKFLPTSLLAFLLVAVLSNPLQAQDEVVIYFDTIGYSIDPVDTELYTIPVRVQNFVDIVGAQVDVRSDAFPTATIETVIPGDDLPVNSFTSSIGGGGSTASTIFLELNANGLTLADDAILFSLEVRITGPLSDCISFSYWNIPSVILSGKLF